MLARVFVFLFLIAICASPLAANVYTPDNIGAPFAVQPDSGLFVTGGVTQPFFSDISGLGFPPGILDILAGLTAYDEFGNPISTFTVTGVTVTQGVNSFSPELAPFDLSTPVTYTSTLNPLNQVTVNPGDYNLAFAFNSDTTFQYSYALDVTGVPNGGFLLFNDVEGALVPEPDLRIPLVSLFLLLGCWLRLRRPDVKN